MLCVAITCWRAPEQEASIYRTRWDFQHSLLCVGFLEILKCAIGGEGSMCPGSLDCGYLEHYLAHHSCFAQGQLPDRAPLRQPPPPRDGLKQVSAEREDRKAAWEPSTDASARFIKELFGGL